MTNYEPQIKAAIQKVLQKNSPKVELLNGGITGKQLNVEHKGKTVNIPLITNSIIQRAVGTFR